MEGFSTSSGSLVSASSAAMVTTSKISKVRSLPHRRSGADDQDGAERGVETKFIAIHLANGSEKLGDGQRLRAESHRHFSSIG